MGGSYMSVLLTEGTKRIVELDKSNLTRIDNYRQTVYNQYKTGSAGLISTTTGYPLWANYNVASGLTVDMGALTWHCNYPGTTQEVLVTVTGTMNTLTSGEYMYGVNRLNGILQSNRSTSFRLYYLTDTGTEYTLMSTNLYGLQGNIRVIEGVYLMTIELCINIDTINAAVWSDEFVLPNLNLTVLTGRYAG